MNFPGDGPAPVVLLVEDSPTQARRTQIDLERKGLRVFSVGNGRQALTAAAERPPDLILSDVLMPEVDGFRLCLEARMHDSLRAIPIILRSAQFIAPEDRGLAMAAGADAYVHKDLSPDQLVDVIFATIEAARGERVYFDPETFRSEYGSRLLARLVQEAADLEFANDRLMESQARLQGLLDNAPMSIYVKDRDARYMMANPQHLKLVGDPPAEITGRTDEDLFTRETAALLRARDDEVLAAGGCLEFEETLTSEKGTRYLSTVKFPLFDPDGSIREVCTISMDVTERRKLEKEIRDFQKMETVGLLAGGVAHDFGNYLSVITTYASLLEEEMGTDERRRSDVVEIRRAAEAATRLARQLMTLSRREPVVPELLDVNEVVSDLENLLSIATGAGVSFEERLAPDLPLVTINASHLEQVLMNLAFNARDAMPSGGDLVIETARTKMPGPEGSEVEAVRLRVADTGEGMTTETVAHIFDPFFTTKTRKKGTGLGLATIKKVIDEAGGHIAVRSTPGEGTVFDITLPATRMESATPPSGIDQKRSGDGQRILIVDDDPGMRAWLERVLGDVGFETITAASAEAADRLVARKGDVDLLVVDIFLPGKTGLELVETLKVRIPSLKVIVISGFQELAFPEGKIDLDLDFLEKPIEAELLLETVRKLLATQSNVGPS